jgi:hypothetical protein
MTYTLQIPSGQYTTSPRRVTKASCDIHARVTAAGDMVRHSNDVGLRASVAKGALQSSL